MLMLSRKVGQSISVFLGPPENGVLLGTFVIAGIDGNKVVVGCDADPDVRLFRTEIVESARKEEFQVA